MLDALCELRCWHEPVQLYIIGCSIDHHELSSQSFFSMKFHKVSRTVAAQSPSLRCCLNNSCHCLSPGECTQMRRVGWFLDGCRMGRTSGSKKPKTLEQGQHYKVPRVRTRLVILPKVPHTSVMLYGQRFLEWYLAGGCFRA